MKGNYRKISYLVGVLFLCLAVFTGCSGEVENSVGNIRLSDGYSARGLALREELLVPTDDIYWAYTAEKVDGLYTEGESKKVSGASTGITALDACADGKYCILRPVKQGPASGLNGASVGPFATGDWKIKIYGYLSCAVNSDGKMIFKDLIYTGVPSGVTTKVVAGAEADVIFALTACNSDLLPKGTLAFDTVRLTVPETKHFYGLLTGTLDEEGNPVPDTVVKARVFDATTLIAQSVTTVTTDCPAGTSLTLNPFVPVNENSCKLTAGEHNLVVAVEYQDKYTKERSEATGTPAEPSYKYTSGDDAVYYETGFAKVGDLHVYSLTFENGKKYVLFQDLNDLTPASETPGKTKALVPYEAKMLKSGSTTEYDYYETFGDAVTVFADVAKPIVLLCDVDSAGTVSKSVTVDPNGFALRNLIVSGATVTVTLKPGNLTTRVYEFEDDGAKLNLFSSSSTAVVIDTAGGSLTVNTTDNVIHSGSAANVTITKSANTKASNLGYHLQADVTGELKIAEGFLDICGSAKIEKLNVTATTSDKVVLKGTLDNVVNQLFNNTVELTNGSVGNADVDASNAFRVCTLNGNGQKVTGTTYETCYIYGVEGMYFALPEFTTTSRTSFTAFPPTMFISPVRTNGSQLGFVMWTTAADGSGTVYCENSDRNVFGTSDITVYAQWGAPVGGKVFYVDSTGASNYRFFTKTASGFTAASAAPSVGTDGIDMVYTLTNKTYSGKDRYYIYNGDAVYAPDGVSGHYLQYQSNGFDWVSNSTEDRGKFAPSYTASGKTYTIKPVEQLGLEKADLLALDVGDGRNNTDYILNLDKIYGSTGFESDLYNPNTYLNGGGFITLFSVLLDFRQKKIGGCSDWYIPSYPEAGKLILNCYEKWGIYVGGEKTGRKNLEVFCSAPSEYTDHHNGTACNVYVSKVIEGGATTGVLHQAWRLWLSYGVECSGNRSAIAIRSF